MSQELADTVRAVLDAARGLVHGVREGEDPIPLDDTLTAAVLTLESILATPAESVRPWREVLAGDEVHGSDGRWHPIVAVFGTGTPDPKLPPTHSGNAVVVEIKIKDTIRKYRKAGMDTVTVRRPRSGESDVIATLEAAGIAVSTVVSKGDR